MGTVFTMVSSEFSISKNLIEKAFDAVKKHGVGYYEDFSTIERNCQHYDFFPISLKLQTLVNQGWGFQLDLENNKTGKGNIVKIEWVWEKNCESDILKVLAPFVEEGSYIEMRSECGDHWRWLFSKGNLIEQRPTIVWSET